MIFPLDNELAIQVNYDRLCEREAVGTNLRHGDVLQFGYTSRYISEFEYLYVCPVSDPCRCGSK